MSVSAKRNAQVEITSSAAGMDRGLNDARRKMRSFERDSARSARQAQRDQAKADRAAARDADRANKQHRKNALGAGNSAASLGHGVLMGAAAAAGFDLAGVVGRSVKGVFEFEKELTRFQIDAQISGQKAGEFRDQIMRVSSATGVSRESILEAAHAYQILTGDAEGAVQSSSLMARTMNATGASGEDIAATLAALHNMKIDPKDYEKAMDVLVYQGHKGAIEVRDLAGQMGSLQPMFSMFKGGNSIRGIAEMGAGMQMMRKGFGSAEEMATGFRAAMSELIDPKVAKKLEKFNVKLFEIDPKTKQQIPRDFMEIMRDIHNSKLGGNAIELRGVFANVRGFRAIQEAESNYEEMARLAKEAEDSGQVAHDNATYMLSTTGRMAKAWNDLEIAIAKALTPDRIEKFAAAAQKALSFIVDSIAAIDHFVAGPGKEAAGVASQDLLDEAQRAPKKGIWERGLAGSDETSEEIEAAAIEHAKKMFAGEDDWANGKYGGAANAKEGARKFLNSEGIDTSSWGDLNRKQNGAVQIAALAGGQITPEQIAKALGAVLAAELPKLNIQLNVDGTQVNKAVNNSMQARKAEGRKG